jgi:hypothetical protein
MIKEMSDNDIVKILFIMKTDQASLILDMLSKLGPDQAKRAASLTMRLQQILPSATNATASAASP